MLQSLEKQNANKQSFILEQYSGVQHTPRGTIMPTDRKKMDKIRRGYKQEIAILEEKCKFGNATKDEQQELAKLKKKLG